MAGGFHGGAFWEGIGNDFSRLDRRADVVPADVLDAWFSPTPGAVGAISEAGEWAMLTSPPVDATGLANRLCELRGVPSNSLLVGAGSSSLIYLAFTNWLTPRSRVLLIDPTYGEYAHLCENVLAVRPDVVRLSASDGFRLDISEWAARLETGDYDLAVLVNPNNPTGQVFSRDEIAKAIEKVRERTRIWIDEAYLDYTGEASCEALAAESGAPEPDYSAGYSMRRGDEEGDRRVFVVKSLSKGYALSGLRAAYMVGPPSEIKMLAPRCPPWSVSLPAQIAALRALGDPAYYQRRYQETEALRGELIKNLSLLGGEVAAEGPSWILYRLPDAAPDAEEVVIACRAAGVYLRNAGQTSEALRARYLRIAVRPREEQERIVAALRAVLANDATITHSISGPTAAFS